jgi:3-deoxy-manno-octulosonate cytidylyltransferase (CMP-KDO synthetase)
VIPARLGATRLPGKPLRLVGGAPLVVRVLERAVAVGVAERCVVATDSAEVLDAVRRAGGECVLTAAEHPSGTDRVAEVAALAAYRAYDTIVNIQGDEPFASADAVRGAVDCVASGRFPLGTVSAPLATDALDEPSVVKVVTADDGRALYFSRAAIPHLRDPEDRDERDATVRRHVGIYAYSRDALATWVALPVHPLERIERLEQLRPLAHGLAIGVARVREAPAPGVDTEDDLARANDEWTRVHSPATSPGRS